MLYTLKICLYPSSEQSEQLLKTMERFNAACKVISKLAFDNKTFGKIKLQQICCYDIRERFKLSAQMVVRAVGKVTESYSDKNKRDSQHFFKPQGTIVYDDRILTVKSIDTVSILTDKFLFFVTDLPDKPEVVVEGFTSRTCSKCGHEYNKSRKDQEDFVCTSCGYAFD